MYTTKELSVELIMITPNAEKVIEKAGRTCYLSFDKSKEGSEKGFIEKLMKMGHESPLEHASATFRIKNCSRAMTHQLVRHRLMSISQQSQRYVSEDNFNYVLPESVSDEYVQDYHDDMQTIRQMYLKWRCRGMKREDARYVLPNACVSEIVVTANFREWRHIMNLRLSKKAQWEIRNVCHRILALLKEHSPGCFADIEV